MTMVVQVAGTEMTGMRCEVPVSGSVLGSEKKVASPGERAKEGIE